MKAKSLLSAVTLSSLLTTSLNVVPPMAVSAQTQQPNFLIVVTDQQHKYAIGKRDKNVITPNIDALADNGVMFNNAYTANPFCVAARRGLFSGMLPSNLDGSTFPSNIKTLAQTFNENGYETSHIGKWHIGGMGNVAVAEENRGGFKHFIGFQSYNEHVKDVKFFDENNKVHNYNYHREDVTTDLAVERLKMLKETGKPFLQVVAYQGPHYLLNPPQKYYDLYKDKTFPYDPNYIEVDPYTESNDPPSVKPKENDPYYQRYGNNMQEYLRLYYAMITQIDDGVGKMVDTLKELGLKDNTIIIFTSDHGDMQGSHGIKNKFVPQEKSSGVPFIVSVPGGRQNAVVDGNIGAMVDIYPSLLEYAGIKEVPSNLEGHSFASYTLGREQEFNYPVFSENSNKGTGNEPWKMVKYGKYKLAIIEKNLEPFMLFDLESDPYEMTNLVKDPKYNNVIKTLLAFFEKKGGSLDLKTKEVKAYDSDKYSSGNNIYKTFAPKLAFDGTKGETSRWVSATDAVGPQYLEIDLAGNYVINSAKLTVSPAYPMVPSKLQYFSDNSWVDIEGSELKQAWNSTKNNVADMTFNEVTTSKIRMVFSGSAAVRVQELQLFGKAEGETQDETNKPLYEKIKNSLVLILNSNHSAVNGIVKKLDADSAVVPFVENGRTLVPLRFIAENLGATVNYENDTKKITISYKDKKINFFVDSNEFYINDTKQENLEVNAKVVAGRTLIPLRAAVSAMGKEVFWDNRGIIVIGDDKDTFNSQSDGEILEQLVGYINPNGTKK